MGALGAHWPTFWTVWGQKKPKFAKVVLGLNMPAPFLRPKWSQWVKMGFPNGAKIIKKMIKKTINIWKSFLMDFFVDFGSFLMPKWSQMESKVAAKTHLNTKTPPSLKSYKNQ